METIFINNITVKKAAPHLRWQASPKSICKSVQHHAVKLLQSPNEEGSQVLSHLSILLIFCLSHWFSYTIPRSGLYLLSLEIFKLHPTVQHSKACPFANHLGNWLFIDKTHDLCRVPLWTWLICLSPSEVQISLQLYILNIQATFCWNRGQDNLYPIDNMFGPPSLWTRW